MPPLCHGSLSAGFAPRGWKCTGRLFSPAAAKTLRQQEPQRNGGGAHAPATGGLTLTFTEPQAALPTPATGGVLVAPEAHAQIKFRNAASIRPPFVGVVLLHVQDEAEMRLLSTDAYDGGPIPKRGRASKVQLNVLDLLIRGVRVGIPTELVALANKTSRTLATCFENLLRDVLGNIFDETPATGGVTAPATGGVTTPATGGAVPIYLVHFMVGDAIAANELAARLLWAIHKQKPLAKNVVYFLLAIRCGNHQAALSAKYAVSGVGAKTASGDSNAYAAVAGTAVRLYKYVIGDYFHDFAKSAREWGRSNVAAWPSGFGSQPQAAALRSLYGPRVVPDAVMDHLRDVAAFHEDRRADITERWQSFLVNHLLRTDDHPTESRFFTFRQCIDNMLLMTLLEFEDTLKLENKQLREQNAKRINRIRRFFKTKDSGQALRRASLCMQMTGQVEKFMATKPRPDTPPPVVGLAKGEVHAVVEEKMSYLLDALPSDPNLQLGPAATALVACAVDILLRLDSMQEWPTLICLLCRKWNPSSYMKQCLLFLRESEDNLDVGFSLQFRRIVNKHGNEMKRLDFLDSTPVQ